MKFDLQLNWAMLFLWGAMLLLLLGVAEVDSAAAEDRNPVTTSTKIPVILDTDIGDDIDDTWALGFLLKCPELDLKLVVGDHGKVIYRAQLLARFLEAAGRTDVPIGLGLDVNASGSGVQEAWVKDYSLNHYPGRIYPDGVQALIDVIMKSPVPVTLIAIGPLPNIKAALAREPRITQKARFVGMHGSVRLGYDGSRNIAAEYNVKADALACRHALSAEWPIAITPLDTCGLVRLSGIHYQRLSQSKDPIATAIVENYNLWSRAQAKTDQPFSPPSQSSILFDTVAVFLAFNEKWMISEELQLVVTKDGFTRIDPAGKTMRVAMQWTDLEAFRQFLTDRLAGP